MGRIFISYRRAESIKDVGRLYDRLVLAFGRENVFKDTENIEIGENFTEALINAVNACDVLLAIVGPQWLTIAGDDGQPRITKQDDFVRLEVSTALDREDCTVIPLLIDNAKMPSPSDLPPSLSAFWKRNAMKLRIDPDFHRDVNKIIASLSKMLNLEVASPSEVSANLNQLIANYFIAREKSNWDEARETLAQLREIEYLVPEDDFNIDEHEDRLWQGIKQHERSRHYLELKEKITSGEKHDIAELIKTFEASYPNYDPEGVIHATKGLLEKQKRKQITDTKMRRDIGKTATERIRQSPPVVKQYPSIQKALSSLFEWVDIPAGRVSIDGSYASYIPFDTNQDFDVPNFKIAKYPITNRQYQTFVDDGGYDIEYYWTKQGWALRTLHQWSQPLHIGQAEVIGQAPVVGISWYEAIAFCKWLSTVLKQPITLPTEQQWQWAAQGDTAYLYPWGTQWDDANCNATNRGVTVVTAHKKNRSPFGVHDMVGNTWEWCLNDWETGSININQNAHWRVLRGGAWDYSNYSFFRVSYRYRMYRPDERHRNVGFRIVTQ